MSSTLVVAFIGVGFKLMYDYEYIPNLVSVESVKNKYFDYIIIGSGTAGSVLSYELSKHSNYTILLIEAGGVFNGLSSVPIMSTLIQGTEMDWGFKTVPQKYSSRGLKNGQQSMPRGKGLGGSHQLNYLLHFNGLKKDFDRWKRLGADGWDYKNLEFFLNRHETDINDHTTRQSRGNECQSGNDTPKLSITSNKRMDSKLSDAFLKAENEMQKAFNPNITFNLAKFTTKKGVRHSVFHEYLRRTYKHKNLSIMVHAKVERIKFNENKEAISVIVKTKSHPVVEVHANREIIISAGAIQTPHILKLSGIGDREELKSVGINLLHHSPGVGENLFDHLNFPLFVSINETASVTKNKILSTAEIYRYLIHGSGALSTTAVVGSLRLDDYGMVLFGTGSADEKMLKHIANLKTETFRAFFPLQDNSSQEGFVALSTCSWPKSRGSVRLDPMNIYGNPLIDPAYLKDVYDISCMKNALKLSLKMISTNQFRHLGSLVHWPKLKSCENFNPKDTSEKIIPDDRYLDCLIRHAALTAHHPGGTVAIGTVIDNNLRVFGVNKLRVVDGSIFPAPVSGFPNSIIIAMAEKASKIILNCTHNKIP